MQGPGGNTSIKAAGVMWIKASGTDLAEAETRDISVPLDRAAALAEARREAGDGSCKAAVLDPMHTLSPSNETTFHAALDWPVIAHTHFIDTLVQVVAPEGRVAARDQLAGLPAVFVSYAKPGLPPTREILARAASEARVFVLESHGLIVCGADVAATAALMEEVAARLIRLAHPAT